MVKFKNMQAEVTADSGEIKVTAQMVCEATCTDTEVVGWGKTMGQALRSFVHEALVQMEPDE